MLLHHGFGIGTAADSPSRRHCRVAHFVGRLLVYELNSHPFVRGIEREALTAHSLIQGPKVDVASTGLRKEDQRRVEPKGSIGIERIPEHRPGWRHRATLPAAAEECPGRKTPEDKFHTPDFFSAVRPGHQFEPIGVRRGGNPGTARVLSLPARRRQALGLDRPSAGIVGKPCTLWVEPVCILEGDDLKSHVPAAEIEERITKVEAELVHAGFSSVYRSIAILPIMGIRREATPQLLHDAGRSRTYAGLGAARPVRDIA